MNQPNIDAVAVREDIAMIDTIIDSCAFFRRTAEAKTIGAILKKMDDRAATVAKDECEARRERDADLDQALGERDKYHEWADILAENIALYFGADIGEHSNLNCPWAEALEVIEHAINSKPEASAATQQAVTDAARRFLACVNEREDAELNFTTADGHTEYDRARSQLQKVLAAPISEDTAPAAPSGIKYSEQDRHNITDGYEPSVSNGDALPPLPRREVQDNGLGHDDDAMRAYVLADRAARTVNTSIGEDAEFWKLLMNLCKRFAIESGFSDAYMQDRAALIRYIDSRQPCQTEPAKGEVEQAHELLSKHCVAITNQGAPMSLLERINELYSWYADIVNDIDEPQSPAQVNAESDSQSVMDAAARAIFTTIRPANMIDADWDSGAVLGADNVFREQCNRAADAAIRALKSTPSVAPVEAMTAEQRQEATRQERIGEAVAYWHLSWPDQLSNVMFFNGARITKAEFEARAILAKSKGQA